MIRISIDVQSVNMYSGEGSKTFSNGYIFLILDESQRQLKIYEADVDSHHPVYRKKISRGCFIINPVHDDYYALVQPELPGKECMDSMLVSHSSDCNNNITVRFRLGDSNESYKIYAHCLRTDSIYAMIYPLQDQIQLPVEASGFEFSVMPEYDQSVSIDGFIYGFSPAIKFLKLNDLSNEYFSSSGVIEISLPLFSDEIFELWCIDGEIIRITNEILNERIVWHGKEFKPYHRLPALFDFEKDSYINND